MNRTILSCAVALLAALTSQCNSMPSCLTVTPPKISLTGQKTAIERQIVGEYAELEKDAWAISSLKTSVEGGKIAERIAEGDPELYKALKVMEYHRMKLRAYKNEGALGETYGGFCAYLPVTKYESRSIEKDLLLKVIEEENRARRTYFSRSLMRANNAEPDEDAIASFGVSFAEEMRAAAQKNDWIQKRNGEWIKKQ